MIISLSLVALLVSPLVLAEPIDPLALLKPTTDHNMRYSLCGKDDSVEAICSAETEPAAYQTSKAVLRIQKNGYAHCTGWLVGNQGHVLTNNHCIGDASESPSLKFEAMAEGTTCAVNCKDELACPGKIIHSEPLEFVATGGDTDKDWTLLRLPAQDRQFALENYGYLRLRKSGGIVGERIYLPGHPAGSGKRIAFLDGNKNATILSTTYNTGCGFGEVIYKADSLPGSSGSPLIAYGDNLVVAIHHCGGCNEAGNSAVHVSKLYAGLANLLPLGTFV